MNPPDEGRRINSGASQGDHGDVSKEEGMKILKLVTVGVSAVGLVYLALYRQRPSGHGGVSL